METALLKVRNNVLSALNEGSAVLLMLDLSAAFDTIGHQILLSYLHNIYSIKGEVCKYMIILVKSKSILEGLKNASL